MASLASSAAPRPRGRPARPDAELRAAILDAATWLLLNEGYGGATLEAVARRAGMAKKTVYRFAANREDLVAQVVRGWTDSFEPALAQEVASAAEVLPALARVLQTIADRALSADAVGMFRLLTADFPARNALLAVYQENGIERGTAMLAGWFEKLAARGLIRIKQPRQTAGLLLAMTIAEPLRQMALGLVEPLPRGSIAERIQACVALFSGQGKVFEVLPD
ncbi:TetR family transcriptional regulator [Achromobacter xylosoxidans]|jgi:TetR/AcrR family transcriptional regulator, mexJK operon transcriptional repressor|uniref:TetR/AcrR family transcriptional regulator n=2 Tax=Achromobacter TaxID=222 RepID=A0A2M9GUN2_9BURK|nr:TetR/AcrR family transcriptional regulator [Achromobacter ruhlandii]AMG46937.1 TetR/AcrR family transcriptional regulator [Achromobacter xylosoxidans]MCV6799811.1 TetR/AcrR family transcriptional regulator [Achromobacter ruhlandii]MCV6801312.1 TetR/AcrR family transcriptional regulator [Achromobacter ruhlandii]MCV6812251.1 TetR/AcrR family transcriptional regulator [Achromobacter ruhlandii]MCV6822340.1 TetR/AcrR family transcriptional regulator [Achromobacter ruhlandii]